MERSYLLFPAAQDHKRALDGDEGLNTGGMGTFSPPPKLLTPELEERVRREVIDPFIAGLQRMGSIIRGMLFPGLMITADGPKVLEFNCRFGDPETQVLLTRLESDLVELLEATIDGRLASVSARWKPRSRGLRHPGLGRLSGQLRHGQDRSAASIAAGWRHRFSRGHAGGERAHRHRWRTRPRRHRAGG